MTQAASDRERLVCAEFAQGCTYRHIVPAANPEERNSVVHCFCQLGEFSVRLVALNQLLEQVSCFVAPLTLLCAGVFTILFFFSFCFLCFPHRCVGAVHSVLSGHL